MRQFKKESVKKWIKQRGQILFKYKKNQKKNYACHEFKVIDSTNILLG